MRLLLVRATFASLCGGTRRISHRACSTPTTSGTHTRARSIASVLTDGFNHPGYGPTSLTADNGADFVFRRFDALHDLDKVVLRGIITPSLAQRIALDTAT